MIIDIHTTEANDQEVQRILDDAADLGMKMIAMAFGVPASTVSIAQPSGLEIVSQIREMYELLNQPLYYVTSEYVERGKVLYSAGTLATPESIVVHPDDLAKVSIPGRRLVHLRDYKPTLGEVIVLLEDMATDEAQQNAGHVDQTQPASQKGDF